MELSLAGIIILIGLFLALLFLLLTFLQYVYDQLIELRQRYKKTNLLGIMYYLNQPFLWCGSIFYKFKKLSIYIIFMIYLLPLAIIDCNLTADIYFITVDKTYNLLQNDFYILTHFNYFILILIPFFFHTLLMLIELSKTYTEKVFENVGRLTNIKNQDINQLIQLKTKDIIHLHITQKPIDWVERDVIKIMNQLFNRLASVEIILAIYSKDLTLIKNDFLFLSLLNLFGIILIIIIQIIII